MLSSSTLQLVGRLHDQQGRRAAARALATDLGVEDLIIFTSDPEIGMLLPAPGFPQTLTPGREWRAFVAACVTDGRHEGMLTYDGRVVAAHGAVASDGSVLVLLGGEPCAEAERVADVVLLIPVLASAFERERAVIAASGHAAAARQAAQSASRTAAALDSARLDLQAALARAQHALAERDAFVSVAAHELNTPLTSLKALAQLQRRRLDRMDTIDPAWIRETLERVDTQTTKLARLVRQLLDLHRLEAGHLPLETAEHDVVDLVYQVVDAARMQSQTHVFNIDAPPSLRAEIDALRLEQVIANVIDNATKYSPDGGLILVEVTENGATFCITITDEGIGIPSAQRERIFDRFHRAHATSQLSGLGIGLFVSRQIVNLHGGQITVENRDDGQGSCFAITLPLATNSGAVQPAPIPSVCQQDRVT